MEFIHDPRFAGIKPFEKKIWLSSPTMHREEQHWVDDAILTNWVSTVGANIDVIEQQMAAYIGCKYAVALSCGTAALHLATKLNGRWVEAGTLGDYNCISFNGNNACGRAA